MSPATWTSSPPPPPSVPSSSVGGEKVSKPVLTEKRLRIKKRRSEDDSDAQAQQKINLSSYDSAFLSGLFSDLAEVTEPSSATSDSNSSQPELEEENNGVVAAESLTKSSSNNSIKRRRISTGGSLMLSRSGPSQKNLSILGCLWDNLESTTPTTTTTTSSPHWDLPATVSDSFPSHQDLLAAGSTDSADARDGADKQNDFGWFVDLDEQQKDIVDAYASSSSKYADLAFVAPTAPKGPVNRDAELQWAQAADTVDDVLGDLF